MRVEVTTEPTTEPVTTAEAKAHLWVDHDSDDALIDALVAAARRTAEARTGASFVSRTLRATFDAVEGAPPLTLPRGPVASVTSFEVWSDAADDWQTVAGTNYYVAGDRLCLVETGAGDWPTADRTFDAYRVTYVAGWGAAAAVPDDVKQAIKVITADLYEKRETQIGAGLVLTEVPYSAARLLDFHTNYQFG